MSDQRHFTDSLRRLEDAVRPDGSGSGQPPRATTGTGSHARKDPRPPNWTDHITTRRILFGGVLAALHWGPPRSEDGAGPVDQASRSIADATKHLQEETKSGAEDLALALFHTDFSEPETLANWWQLPEASLSIEPFEAHMSAIPRGPSLAKPTRAMTDGKVFFRFVQSNNAAFILRGQEAGDCYRIVCSRDAKRLQPEMVVSAWRRRKGTDYEIAQASVPDVTLAGLSQFSISVEMDGADFAARLYWREPRTTPFLGPYLPLVDRERVVATWKDKTFRDGAVGVWGPAQGEHDKFRVLEVKAEV